MKLQPIFPVLSQKTISYGRTMIEFNLVSVIMTSFNIDMYYDLHDLLTNQF